MSLTNEVIKALKRYGFEAVAAGLMPSVYPEIYKQRAKKSQLTGLEPPWEEERAICDYVEDRNVVVAVLLPYSLLPVQTREPVGHVSRISIMAAEWDYHTVFKMKLSEALSELMVRNPEARMIFHVDNGPLPERHISLELGLTKAGKSQMVVSELYGTAFYIGLVLIKDSNYKETLSISNGYQLHEACLNCNKCQTHCPSGALRAEGGFDGMLCISAVTQFKGPLSEVQMAQINQQIYGCDHCQLSCPINSPLFKTYHTMTGIKPLKAVENNSIAPEELLYLSQKAYKKKYGHLGFAWRGVKTIKRNALINMANSGDSTYIKVIEHFIASLEPQEEAVLYETAQWAIRKLKQSDRGEEP